ncbi:hypothetical protein ES703_70833 [subsurface metagenome]
MGSVAIRSLVAPASRAISITRTAFSIITVLSDRITTRGFPNSSIFSFKRISRLSSPTRPSPRKSCPASVIVIVILSGGADSSENAFGSLTLIPCWITNVDVRRKKMIKRSTISAMEMGLSAVILL